MAKQKLTKTQYDAMATKILDLAFMIHRELGPGLLESLYVKILVRELKKAGFSVKVEVPIHVNWDDEDMGLGYRADIVVDDIVVLEIKAAEGNPKLWGKQLLTYLKLLDRRLGYVINFNEVLLKDGINRVANDLR
jgi:GxxExxY protein